MAQLYTPLLEGLLWQHGYQEILWYALSMQHQQVQQILVQSGLSPRGQKGQCPICSASPFPHGISAASSVWTLLGGKDSKKKQYCCLFQDLCLSTLHGLEKYSSEFSICIVTWAAAGGGMGIRKEKDRTEGRKTRTEEESSVGKEISGKCTQSLLLLYCLKLREEQKFLHRSAACCFVHLGFAKCIAIYKLQIWYLHVKDRGFT